MEQFQASKENLDDYFYVNHFADQIKSILKKFLAARLKFS